MLAICARYAIIRDFYDFKGYDSQNKKYRNKDGSKKIYNQHGILSPSISSECKKNNNTS